jgi:hypothetical protein
VAENKTDTERLADTLIKGLPFEPGKVRDQCSFNLKRDGKTVAEVLARSTRLRLNLTEAPSAKQLKALKVEPEPVKIVKGEPQTGGRWALGLIVTEDNLVTARALLEAVAKS